MRVKVNNKEIFPGRVRELLQALYSAGFFEECMLIGSWVMPIYQEAFGMNYSLRTMDIDFAIKIVHSDRDKKIDIDKIITDLGYLPVVMQSGIRKFTRENFTIEFIVQRRGGKDDEVVSIKKWNIVAIPLPFVDILLAFPFTADFKDFKVRAPLPEAFFVQKLITASRRRDGSKKDKDLEQCEVMVRHLNADRLRAVAESLKISKKAQKALVSSCEAIDFPLHLLVLK